MALQQRESLLKQASPAQRTAPSEVLASHDLQGLQALQDTWRSGKLGCFSGSAAWQRKHPSHFFKFGSSGSYYPTLGWRRIPFLRSGQGSLAQLNVPGQVAAAQVPHLAGFAANPGGAQAWHQGPRDSRGGRQGQQGRQSQN